MKWEPILNATFSYTMLFLWWFLVHIFPYLALLVHVWTTFIAYKSGGLTLAFLTFSMPYITDFMWMYKLYGQHNLFSLIVLITLILSIPSTFLRKSYLKRKNC